MRRSKYKTTVAVGEMCDRLKAAVDARRDENFVVMARTDAFAREGRAAALERAAAYVAAGADMVFAEALYTLDDYAAFTAAVDVPVLANLTEFGLTPCFSFEVLASMASSRASVSQARIWALCSAVRSGSMSW